MFRGRKADSYHAALADERLLEVCLRGVTSRVRRGRIRLVASLTAGAAALASSTLVDWQRVLPLEALGFLSALAFLVLAAAGFLLIARLQGRESRARAAALSRVENLSPSEGQALLQAERFEARGGGCATALYGGMAFAGLVIAANYFLPLPERARFTLPTAVVAFPAAFLLARAALAALFRDLGAPRAELELRYGAGPRGTYLRQARAALEADGAPDWIALLTGTGQPHGARRWIRADLWCSRAPRLRAEVRTCPRWGWGEDEAAGFARGEAEPGEEPGRELQRLLEADGLEDVDADLFDGFPCTVTVLRRQPALEKSAHCVLGGSPDPGQPAIALAQLLLRIADEVPTPPLIARLGATSARGDITEERR